MVGPTHRLSDHWALICPCLQSFYLWQGIVLVQHEMQKSYITQLPAATHRRNELWQNRHVASHEFSEEEGIISRRRRQ